MNWRVGLRWWLPALLLQGATGCALHGESLAGVVSEKNLPSANAFVIATWSGVIPRPAEGAGVCLHTTIVKTDAYGHFEVPGWFQPFSLWNIFPVINRSASIMVYKPGFESQPGAGFMFQSGGSISLMKSIRKEEQLPSPQPSTGTFFAPRPLTPTEQLVWIGNLADRGVSCSRGEDDADDPQHVMREYYLALDEGVRQLGIQSAESTSVSETLKNKLYPNIRKEREEQPLRVQIYAPPPAGQAGTALQKASPALSSGGK